LTTPKLIKENTSQIPLALQQMRMQNTMVSEHA